MDSKPKRRNTPTAEDYALQIQQQLGDSWLPRIYSRRVRTKRTRAYKFKALARNGRVEIQHTLLGVELKAGGQRMLCPDLATARYLAVFARAGCNEVAVPYDITQISQLADELDSSWHRTLLLVGQLAGNESDRTKGRIRNLLTEKIRHEIGAAGAGAISPEFKQTTRQRK